jgi:Na+/H+-dicarboxylate symporter
MNRFFTVFVVAGMVLGVAVGWACNTWLDAAHAKQAADGFGIVTDTFLRLIKMIIAPLVFSTLVAGIARMEDAATVGRVGAKTMLWFILGSLVSLALGLVMVRWLQPGLGLHLALPPADLKPAGVDASTMTVKDFIAHMIPTSIVDAMAKNEILQIVVFSILVGTAVASLDDRAPAVVELVEQVAKIMLKVTSYVMMLAPLAIFAALAATVAQYGMAILATYAKFVGGYYISLVLLWAVMGLAAFLFVGKRAFALFVTMRQPALLAFSTASSEAAYPKTLEQLQRFGVSPKIASFVLPLGYSFNLVGSMMYCTFAVMFICQVYRIQLSLTQQITMLLLLMVTSKGMAGVPRAALVVILATLAYFNLPLAGLTLILAVDHLLDMGRSATNVVGNSVAAVVVARWEKQLSDHVDATDPTPT